MRAVPQKSGESEWHHKNPVSQSGTAKRPVSRSGEVCPGRAQGKGDNRHVPTSVQADRTGEFIVRFTITAHRCFGLVCVFLAVCIVCGCCCCLGRRRLCIFLQQQQIRHDTHSQSWCALDPVNHRSQAVNTSTNNPHPAVRPLTHPQTVYIQQSGR